MRGIHDCAYLFRRHSLLDERSGVAIGRDGDVGRFLHQREFSGRLHHATGAHDRGAVHDIDARHGAAQAIDREEAHGLFDTDRCRDLAIGKHARHGAQRIFVFVPHSHFGRNLEALSHGRLFKMRRNDGDGAVARDHRRGEPLTAPPLDAGEVDQRCAWLDEQGTDAELAHELACPVDAREVFAARDGHYACAHGFEAGDGLRGEQLPGAKCRKRGGGGAEGEDFAAVRFHSVPLTRFAIRHHQSRLHQSALVLLVRLLFDDVRA